MNRFTFTTLIGLMSALALVGCVNLTPPWDKHRDAGPSASGGASVQPSAGADAGAEIDGALPGPSPDADPGMPAFDAPVVEDGAETTIHRADGGRDSLADLTGQEDVRSDGKAIDARESDAATDARRNYADAGANDAPVDASTSVDGAADLPDTSASIVIKDAAPSPDTNPVGALKLSGRPFGTGPAFATHPTATYDKAFDGDPTTYFDDSNAGGGYAGLDVGDNAVVSFIRYTPREGYVERMVGGKFQCSASSQTDGYVDLFTITAVPPSAWTTISISNAPACRYFRYLGGATGHTNLGEIEFWSVAEADGGAGITSASFGPVLFNLALGQATSASSEQTSAGKIAANGNDGLASTMFCPANGDFPTWFQVDLGDVYPLQQTDLIVENAGATYQYLIDVSLDGAEWTPAASHQSDATGGRTTLTDDFQAQARYVRLTFTGASSGNWGCVRELSVWSPAAPPPDAGI